MFSSSGSFPSQLRWRKRKEKERRRRRRRRKSIQLRNHRRRLRHPSRRCHGSRFHPCDSDAFNYRLVSYHRAMISMQISPSHHPETPLAICTSLMQMRRNEAQWGAFLLPGIRVPCQWVGGGVVGGVVGGSRNPTGWIITWWWLGWFGGQVRGNDVVDGGARSGGTLNPASRDSRFLVNVAIVSDAARHKGN